MEYMDFRFFVYNTRHTRTLPRRTSMLHTHLVGGRTRMHSLFNLHRYLIRSCCCWLHHHWPSPPSTLKPYEFQFGRRVAEKRMEKSSDETREPFAHWHSELLLNWSDFNLSSAVRAFELPSISILVFMPSHLMGLICINIIAIGEFNFRIDDRTSRNMQNDFDDDGDGGSH